MKLGAHVSSAGVLEKALSEGTHIGAEAIQIFTSNPKGWSFRVRTDEEIKSFKAAKEKIGIGDVFGHSIYLTNLASQNPYIFTNSINSLISGLVLAEKAGFKGVITHIGAHGGQGTEEGLKQVISALSQVLKVMENHCPYIILETDSGAGTHLGGNFSDIGKIIKSLNSEKIRVCLDTCHVFAAGYDISTEKGLEKTIKEFDKEIGLEKLAVLHLNDSKGELGSKLDRHEIIGQGKIGLEAFRRIVNHPKLREKVGIIETPDNKSTELIEEMSLDILKGLRNEQ